MCLAYSHFLGQTFIHFLGTCCCTIYGVEFRHLNTLYGLAFGRLHGCAQFLTPFSVAVGELFYCLIGRFYVHASGASLGLFLSLYATQMLFVVLHLLALSVAECAHTFEHFVPVYKRSVKLRSVDAHKLGLASNREAASTAHTGTVDHNSVQRNFNRDVIFLCHEAAELHHDRRTNCKNLVNVFFLVDEFLDTYSYYALFAVRSVIGHDDKFVAALAYLIFKYYEVLATSGNN